MMCFPANFGWVMSLIDWFLLPNIAITPFNIILAGTRRGREVTGKTLQRVRRMPLLTPPQRR